MKNFWNKLIEMIERSYQSRVDHYIRMMRPTNTAELDYYLREFDRKSGSQR
jgi:hypothetical protein